MHLLCYMLTPEKDIEEICIKAKILLSNQKVLENKPVKTITVGGSWNYLLIDKQKNPVSICNLSVVDLEATKNSQRMSNATAWDKEWGQTGTINISITTNTYTIKAPATKNQFVDACSMIAPHILITKTLKVITPSAPIKSLKQDMAWEAKVMKIINETKNKDKLTLAVLDIGV